eukprot:7047942-Lingulodinium_polyedra.AAC.1
MLQDRLKVLPHGFMRLHVFPLKFVVMRIASVGIHGSVSMLKLGTTCARAAIEEHITWPMNNLTNPAGSTGFAEIMMQGDVSHCHNPTK